MPNSIRGIAIVLLASALSFFACPSAARCQQSRQQGVQDSVADIEEIIYQYDSICLQEAMALFEAQLGNVISIVLKKGDEGNLRNLVREEARSKYPSSYLFGCALDSIVSKIALKEEPDTFTAEVPANFVVDKIELYMKINKKERKLYVFQKLGSEEITLLETKVALGGMNKDYSTGKTRHFPTPAGEFYIKRIIERPWWYPPSWARQKRPSKPGSADNPYGLWMTELCKNQEPSSSDFYVIGDSKIRIHSTNAPQSIGTYSTHGCIRVHPNVANELFPAILNYSPHKEGKEASRGTVYLLDEPIKLNIVNN